MSPFWIFDVAASLVGAGLLLRNMRSRRIKLIPFRYNGGKRL